MSHDTRIAAGDNCPHRKHQVGHNFCLSRMFRVAIWLSLLAAQAFFGREWQSAAQATGEKQAVNPGGETKPRVLESLTGETGFVNIPAGEFLMGSSNGDRDERPAHRVRISRGFEMGKYEVTQAQWEAVMGSNSSHFKGPNLPVENVSWDEVQDFIQRLNGLSQRYTFRLPTEAEWEYACRAGTTGDYAGSLDAMAWYGANSGNRTHPVGQKQPNAWGLYDMHGNVWEWCQDWYGSNYYEQSPGTDPQGPSSGSGRVVRGGSWGDSAAFCGSVARHYDRSPGIRYRIYRFSFLGFRLVRTAK
jgi:formylglycine-generating enzyme required for sulfatase activity